jgi:hypothetical protein
MHLSKPTTEQLKSIPEIALLHSLSLFYDNVGDFDERSIVSLSDILVQLENIIRSSPRQYRNSDELLDRIILVRHRINNMRIPVGAQRPVIEPSAKTDDHSDKGKP